MKALKTRTKFHLVSKTNEYNFGVILNYLGKGYGGNGHSLGNDFHFKLP